MKNVNGFWVGLQAHRGVSTDCPENTMAAYAAAVEQGYDVIEMDPKFTRDDRCVLLHDRTLNRTARRGDGTAVEAAIAELTLEEARAFEYGGWFGAAFAGEPIPLLEDVLAFAKERGVSLKLDNVIESFTPSQTELLFGLVERSGLGELAGFTCTRTDYISAVAARFPEATVHYDGPVDAERLSAVVQAKQGNRLTVWLPYANRLTSWCSAPPASEERAELVRKSGAKLGLWIIEDEDELADACARFAPDIVETTGAIKPDGRKERQ